METDVIAERLKNLTDMVVEFKEENKEVHGKMITKQDHTNGRVRALERWRMFILGSLFAIGLFGWIIKDKYKESNLTREQLIIQNEQIKDLNKRIQVIENIIIEE